jgi:hypothetical protein
MSLEDLDFVTLSAARAVEEPTGVSGKAMPAPAPFRGAACAVQHMGTALLASWTEAGESRK